MIKIIGGKFQRKKILVPNKEVRPTSAIKREAIFSILESYSLKNSFEIYENKSFIDLFAGSGSLGLEFISRGGSFVYFFENDQEVLKVLKKNCSSLCTNTEYEIIDENINLIKKFKLKDKSISLIFIDPPYKFSEFNNILKIIINSNILNKNSIIIIETKKNNKLNISKKFKINNEKIYGITKLYFIKYLN